MMKKRRKQKQKRLFLFFLFFVCLFALLLLLESRLIPPLKEISHMQCKALANQMIDAAAMENLQKLDTSALLTETNSSYTANTALVNQFCASLSQDITKRLEVLPKEQIRIPLGAATKVNFLANAGPEIPFTLLPMGTVKVDYETAFSSAGINQIHYQIWLNLSMELKIVNPLYQETLTMERKMMLADLIFAGKVPEHYFQMGNLSEYLLTE